MLEMLTGKRLWIRGDWISEQLIEKLDLNTRDRFVEEVESELKTIIRSCLRKK